MITALGAPILYSSPAYARPSIRMQAVGPGVVGGSYQIPFVDVGDESASTGKVQVNLNVSPKHAKTSCVCNGSATAFEIDVGNGYRIINFSSRFDQDDCYVTPIGWGVVPHKTFVHSLLSVSGNLGGQLRQVRFSVSPTPNSGASAYSGTAMIYFTVRYVPT